MILEKIIGDVKVNDKIYKLELSFHSKQPRGSSKVPRVSNITVSLFQKLIDKVNIEKEESTTIIWRHKTEQNDYYKGIKFDFVKDKIKIITMISQKKNTNPDKLFSKESNRFIIEDIRE